MQAAFRRSNSLYRAFVGGRGAGKSWIGAYDLVRRARRGRTYLVGSPTGVLLNDTTYPTFKAIAEDLGVWGGAKLTPYPNVTLTTGATIRFRTAEDPEKLRGPNLTGVWLDEASLMEEGAYKICLGSLREAGEQGWLSATFTPKGLAHWTYQCFGTGKPDTELFHATTADNPFNAASFAATLARQYAGRFAQQELGGEFVALEGAEWPPDYFGEHLWFDDWPPGEMLRVLALDPSKGKDAKVAEPAKSRDGDDSAFADVTLTPDGTLWVDVDANNARDVTGIVRDGLALYRSRRHHAFVVEVNQFQAMLASEFLRQWSAAEQGPLPLYGITNTDPKPVRIRTLGPYLAQRKLRVRDTPGGRKLVTQLRDFPLAKHDDCPDALEMAVRMLLHLLGEGVGGTEPQLVRG